MILVLSATPQKRSVQNISRFINYLGKRSCYCCNYPVLWDDWMFVGMLPESSVFSKFYSGILNHALAGSAPSTPFWLIRLYRFCILLSILGTLWSHFHDLSICWKFNFKDAHKKHLCVNILQAGCRYNNFWYRWYLINDYRHRPVC